MTVKELNERKAPIITIDKSLEKYKLMPIFQDKVDKTNEILRTAGLPKKRKQKEQDRVPAK